MANEYQNDEAYTRFQLELDNLQLFVYAERSHAGRTSLRGRGWLKQSDRNTAYTIEKLGRLAGLRSPLLQVVMAILRGMNPHASRAEWSAKLFQDARMALAQPFDDVERRSGPEDYRPSECVRPFTQAEKLAVLQTLHMCCDDWTGHGWCAERLGRELGMLLTKDHIS